ncbi:MAG: DedA family protein [Hyphomicrobium sp.]
MTIDSFVATIVDFVKHNENWAIPIAFIVAFAESFCFLSILWPGTAILAGITALLAASGADQSIVIPSILAAGFGGTLGYSISYWIGLYFKNSIENIWPFYSRPDLLQHGKNFFSDWGGWGIFIGHFIGPVRAVIPVVAGMFQMNQITFQIANALSAFLWSAGIIAPSFFLVLFREDITLFMQGYPLIIAASLMMLALLNSVPLSSLGMPTLLIFIILAGIFLFCGGDFKLSLGAATLGAFIGDCITYFLGRQQNKKLDHVTGSAKPSKAVQNAMSYLKEKGSIGIVRSKFHFSLRSSSPLAAGIMKNNLIEFFALSFFSCLLWASSLLIPLVLLKLFFGK